MGSSPTKAAKPTIAAVTAAQAFQSGAANAGAYPADVRVFASCTADSEEESKEESEEENDIAIVQRAESDMGSSPTKSATSEKSVATSPAVARTEPAAASSRQTGGQFGTIALLAAAAAAARAADSEEESEEESKEESDIAKHSDVQRAERDMGSSPTKAAAAEKSVAHPATSPAVARTELAAASSRQTGGQFGAVALLAAGVAAAHAADSGEASKIAVVLSHHSDYAGLATAIAEALADRCDVAMMTQSQPPTLEQRESLVSWSSVFVVVASISYQRDMFLMETVNHARTKQKTVIAVVAQRRYRPFGGLGAISIADGELLDGVAWTDAGRLGALTESIRSRLFAVARPPAAPRPALGGDAAPSHPTPAAAVSTGSASGKGIVLSYHSETANVRSLLEAETFDSPIVGILDESSSANSPALTACAVLVAILSPAYERSATCREQYERARALRKPVVPLIGAAGKYSPSGWAALAIAGKLYYKFCDRETAYSSGKRAYLDTVPMVDFKVAVNAQLAPLPDAEAREKAEIDVLSKKIAECKAKLRHWPPKTRPSGGDAGLSQPPEPPRLTMGELLADAGDGLPFNYIHHEVTRLTFKPPAPLFDSRGIPVRQRLQVFISYQWDQQEFVRTVYQDMHDTFNLQVWMDVYGGMLGNANEAMANGIECSDVFLCFLSAKYVASANCTLEIRYALYRKKAFIFIVTEDAIKLPAWIEALVGKNLTFSLRSLSDCGIVDNGLPRINRLCDAVRRLSSKSHHSTYDEDVTEAVTGLRATLEDALFDLAEQENTARWLTCTRCGANFDDNSRSGCKKHRAYFMGGNILAGRWVCCNERSRDGPGCENTDHITAKREFSLMPDYGTHHWVPA